MTRAREGLFLITFAFGASLVLFSEAYAKPAKIYGQCKRGSCEVAAIDQVRLLKKDLSGELKAFFVVQGFESVPGAPLEWSDETSVEWAFCSKTTPLYMAFFGDSSSKVAFGASAINHGDDIIMAAVTRTEVYNYVCSRNSDEPDLVDDAAVQRLIESIRYPEHVFTTDHN